MDRPLLSLKFDISGDKISDKFDKFLLIKDEVIFLASTQKT
jgi:hypothetical protein